MYVKHRTSLTSWPPFLNIDGRHCLGWNSRWDPGAEHL